MWDTGSKHVVGGSKVYKLGSVVCVFFSFRGCHTVCFCVCVCVSLHLRAGVCVCVCSKRLLPPSCDRASSCVYGMCVSVGGLSGVMV